MPMGRSAWRRSCTRDGCCSGADDGRFRCLDLKTGALLWERRAFPEERPDVRLLGNNRLISLWPVRGGAVVVGDTVFLGSGVWPTMGVSVQALDVRTGRAPLGRMPGSAT